MDVRCERCNTEYEFDDALVSGRGTTVKCTNCGHKFKIRRSDGDYSEDFWNVTTADGRTLVFTSLRELQRAIQMHQVDRGDKLSRGGRPPKPIGQIPELAPFFDQRDTARVHAQAQAANAATVTGAHPKVRDPMPTLGGLAPPPATSAQMTGSASSRSSRPPPVPGASPPTASPPQARARQSTRPFSASPNAPADGQPPPHVTQSLPLANIKSTLIGGSASSSLTPGVDPMPAPPAMRSRMASVPPPNTVREDEPDTQRFDRAQHGAPPAPQPGSARPKSTPPPLPKTTTARPPPPTPGSHPPSVKTSLGMPPASQPQQVSAAPHVPPASGPTAATASTQLQPTATPVVPIAVQAAPAPPPPAPAPAFAHTAPMMAPISPPVASTPPPQAVDTSSPLPPPAPFRRRIISELDEEERGEPRGRYASMSDAPSSMGRRRSVGGFIVAAVVAGCVAMLVAVWFNKNGLSFGQKPPPAPTATTDPRAMTFLTTGEKALADGNLDLAKESFDKASALAEKDPHVLLDVARLAASRADVLWLKSRLLPNDATDEHKATRESLGELAAGARKAADDAIAVAPDDPGALRAKIDALRISGDRDGARPLVDRIKPQIAQPETAYVLAALDLAEVEPLWSTVIDRLKVAAAVETGPGRARAALVYALARSGDVTGAKEELERLKALPRQHPLVPQLAAFVERTKASGPKVAAGDAGAMGAGTGVVGINDLPPFDPKHPHPAGGGGDLPRDPRALVAEGEKARARGDYERAKRAYSAALESNPNDSEALSGLAAIAYAQRDLAGARAGYKRVLSINPNYTPALVGLGDTEWDSGDKPAAMKIYKDIVDRLPEGTYPPRVKQRSEPGAPAPTPAPSPSPSPTPTGEKGDKSDQGGF